jgi:hypothetical protein
VGAPKKINIRKNKESELHQSSTRIIMRLPSVGNPVPVGLADSRKKLLDKRLADLKNN